MDPDMEELEDDVVVSGRISAPVILQFEPVGRWFESRGNHVTSPSHRGRAHGVAGVDSEEEEESSDEGEEGEGGTVNPLLLDPTQWKDQDHYAMLGLGRLRYRASPQDIRRAYRQKVLQYHPDKQQSAAGGGAGGGAEEEVEDDYFKCIQIANDILSDTKRRRAYDSVDPTFDDSIPAATTGDSFFEAFGPIFEENSRWSKRKPVPLMGGKGATLSEVDAFYSFWYDFESWREFSYLDEENLEKAENREERRWMEKKNKAARLRSKKEEVGRIRTLVDRAYACDPRVKRFREEERAEKAARRRAKEEATRREAEEREREQTERLQQEKREREKEAEEAKALAAQAKKEKEAVRKALRKERKGFRSLCKSHDYFASSDTERVTRMQAVDQLCEALPVERLQALNEQLALLAVTEAASLVDGEAAALRRKEEEQRAAAATAKASQPSGAVRGASAGRDEWSSEEVQLLVKAVTLHPAGTVKRWETIAQFVNSHSAAGCRAKTSQQVVAKVKALQRLESTEKERVDKKAFATFRKDHVERGHVEAPPTQRFDSPTPWTAEEQKALEAALRTYPSSTEQRWEKIAAAVPLRSKEECVARFKELVARVKAKKKPS